VTVSVRGLVLSAIVLASIDSPLGSLAASFVTDIYRPLLFRRGTEHHYLLVSRLMPVGLALGATVVALFIRTIGEAFTLILNLTAGLGPVYLLRWFWWRVNPWSEISAMVASVIVFVLRPSAIAWLGLPSGLLIELLVMVLGTALIWVPVTLLTPPADRATLKQFYSLVRPPGFWKPVAIAAAVPEPWRLSLIQWVLSTIALLATTIGPLQLMLHEFAWGGALCVVAGLGWGGVIYTLRKAAQ